ncbi:hypothetical protein H0H93_003892 [Arthromyces matolae]|nr:hypothetical protein H0H93_003892 [Arthromyces matolae]
MSPVAFKDTASRKAARDRIPNQIGVQSILSLRSGGDGTPTKSDTISKDDGVAASETLKAE